MPGNILIISIIAIITHGWIFLSNSEIWDGWYVRDWIKNGHLDYLALYYREAGHPFFGWVHLHSNWFPNVSFFYHFLAFGSLLGTSLGIFWLLNARNLFTKNERLWIALFTLVYPGFLATTDSVVTLYLVCYFLFAIGWCLLLTSTNKTNWTRFFLQTLSLLLFFISFFTNSILVFYYGFLLIWLLVDFGKENLKKFVFKYWIFVIWPLVFWTWSKTFVTRAPVHKNYYQLRFDIITIINSFSDFYFNVLHSQLQSLLKSGILIPILLLIAYGFFTKKKYPNKVQLASIVFGNVLLICAVFPYMAVNQGFSVTSAWLSKNNLLIALPLGLTLIGIWGWLDPLKRNYKYIVPGIILSSCIFVQIRSYSRLASSQAKMQAVQLELKNYDFSIVYLNDQFNLRGNEQLIAPSIATSAIRMGMEPAKEILVLTTPPQTKGTYTRNEIDQAIVDTYIPYAFKNLDSDGKQIGVEIEKGSSFRNAEEMGAKYIWLSLTGNPHEMTEFLQSHVKITVQSL
ncbi:MAG: hypothetical protein A4S09_02485 [Proteobacteria bacterium SG_bin7]|nr:MAG: hypothetical protein A4S09_02485 [Proteobacteria bacterium SG_bin7]